MLKFISQRAFNSTLVCQAIKGASNFEAFLKKYSLTHVCFHTAKNDESIINPGDSIGKDPIGFCRIRLSDIIGTARIFHCKTSKNARFDNR